MIFQATQLSAHTREKKSFFFAPLQSSSWNLVLDWQLLPSHPTDLL